MSQTDITDNVLGVTDIVENVTKDVTPPKPVLVPKTKMNEEDFDDQRDGTTTWVDAINDIKERFPK